MLNKRNPFKSIRGRSAGGGLRTITQFMLWSMYNHRNQVHTGANVGLALFLVGLVALLAWGSR